MLQEDVHLVKKIGLDSFRFSISWSRLFPSRTLTLDQSQSSKFIGYWCDLSWVPWHRQWSQIWKKISSYLSYCKWDIWWHWIMYFLSPEGKVSGGVNPKAVTFYNNLINELISNGEVQNFSFIFSKRATHF